MPSSVILAMQYHPSRRELLIIFRAGRGTYRYFDVPLEEWQDFLEAGSKGMYLNEVFKRREHPYERLAIPFGALEEKPGSMEWGETQSLRKGVRRVEIPRREDKIRA